MTVMLPTRRHLTPRWVTNELWKKAQQVPAFDIDFARQTITDRVGNITPTMTRPSSTKLAWNGSTFVSYAADQPAFQYDAATGRFGYLHEPAATSNALNTGDLSVSFCTKANGGASVVQGQNITSVTGNAGTSNKRVNSAGTIGAGTGAYTAWAIIGRNSTQTEVTLLIDEGSNRVRQRFNVVDGTLISSVVTGGTATSAGASVRVLSGDVVLIQLSGNFTVSSALNAGIWFGDFASSASTDTLRVHHFQFETGTVATSPIVTAGSAVTRAADTMTVTGTDGAALAAVLGDQFWAYIDGVCYGATSAGAFVSADDGTNNERWRIGHNATSASQLTVVDGGASQASLSPVSTGEWPLGAPRKAAAVIAPNDLRMIVSGSLLASDTSATIPTVTQFKIGAAQAVGTIPSLLIHRIALFKGVPPDSRLLSVVS